MHVKKMWWRRTPRDNIKNRVVQCGEEKAHRGNKNTHTIELRTHNKVIPKRWNALIEREVDLKGVCMKDSEEVVVREESR